ncbi:type IV pilus assembly protein [Neisseria meningitidis]|nr:type IV pilus assembly protein [Neisseria meningitidis]
MGLGGRGAYALDLTKADGSDPTAVSLFDVKNGNNGKNSNNSNNSVQLGYTVGTPQIGQNPQRQIRRLPRLRLCD